MSYKYQPKTNEQLYDLTHHPKVRLEEIDISEVDDFSNIFENCDRDDFDVIASWDVSHVTNMSGMFAGATKFNADISGWDVSNVTDMSYMFAGSATNGVNKSEMKKLMLEKGDGVVKKDIIDASGDPMIEEALASGNIDKTLGFLASKAVGGAVGYARKVMACEITTEFNIDISDWDVSNVTDMSHMFENASSFDQPIASWDVSSVKNMNCMFLGAKSFNEPLATWDISNVKYMNSMFEGSGQNPLPSWYKNPSEKMMEEHDEKMRKELESSTGAFGLFFKTDK